MTALLLQTPTHREGTAWCTARIWAWLQAATASSCSATQQCKTRLSLAAPAELEEHERRAACILPSKARQGKQQPCDKRCDKWPLSLSHYYSRLGSLSQDRSFRLKWQTENNFGGKKNVRTKMAENLFFLFLFFRFFFFLSTLSTTQYKNSFLCRFWLSYQR